MPLSFILLIAKEATEEIIFSAINTNMTTAYLK